MNRLRTVGIQRGQSGELQQLDGDEAAAEIEAFRRSGLHHHHRPAYDSSLPETSPPIPSSSWSSTASASTYSSLPGTPGPVSYHDVGPPSYSSAPSPGLGLGLGSMNLGRGGSLAGSRYSTPGVEHEHDGKDEREQDGERHRQRQRERRRERTNEMDVDDDA